MAPMRSRPNPFQIWLCLAGTESRAIGDLCPKDTVPQAVQRRNSFRRPLVAALALAAVFIGRISAQAQEAWKPAPAQLMTRWAKDVSPERVRPEYPRPLLVRREWKSLNGLWQFAFDNAGQ